jgi:hypothetical protein
MTQEGAFALGRSAPWRDAGLAYQAGEGIHRAEGCHRLPGSQPTLFVTVLTGRE